MGRLIRGAVAGVVATAVMSLFMLAGKALGLIEETPPREITRRAGEAAGMQPEDTSEPEFGLSWVTAHFGFGALCGVLYSIVRRLVPGGGVISGTAFGVLVWGVSYLGIMPALQLYPWPEEDRESRSKIMLAAHVVFGACLGKLVGRR